MTELKAKPKALELRPAADIKDKVTIKCRGTDITVFPSAGRHMMFVRGGYTYLRLGYTSDRELDASPHDVHEILDAMRDGKDHPWLSDWPEHLRPVVIMLGVHGAIWHQRSQVIEVVEAVLLKECEVVRELVQYGALIGVDAADARGVISVADTAFSADVRGFKRLLRDEIVLRAHHTACFEVRISLELDMQHLDKYLLRWELH